ncbi:MAG: hypothetical protein WB761_26240 [Solirubrobacteraceae bacterium]
MSSPLAAAQLGCGCERDPDGGGEWDVEPEQCAPARQLGYRSAKREPGCASGAAGGAPGGHRTVTRTRVTSDVKQERQRGRHRERGGNPLQAAGGDEHSDGGRERGQHRAGGERRQPEAQHRLVAESCAESCAEHQQSAEAHRVCGHGRASGGGGGTQLRQRMRERADQFGYAENVDELCGAEHKYRSGRLGSLNLLHR